MTQVLSPATEPDSNINIAHYMRNNVPFTIVVVLAMLNQYTFEDIECTQGNQAAIIISFILLTIIDVVWTTYHCKIDFIYNYPYSGSQWKKYAVIRSLTSILAFYSLNYFIHKGTPFNCFFSYNAVAANVMFYLSFLTVATVSYVEHYYWKKLEIPLIPEM
jgi:hypothetical protein